MILLLLKIIFMAADNNNIDLSQEIGIPSIYEIPLSAMKDGKGRVVQQVFFYGDEDGKAFFPPFVNSFSSYYCFLTNFVFNGNLSPAFLNASLASASLIPSISNNTLPGFTGKT